MVKPGKKLAPVYEKLKLHSILEHYSTFGYDAAIFHF